MEIVEFEPERMMGTVIHDANMDIQGTAMFESRDAGRTHLAVSAESVGLD